MTYDGSKLKELQREFRLTPEEVAMEAKMSTGNLRKVYRNESPVETAKAVSRAIESCRQRLVSNLKSKAVS